MGVGVEKGSAEVGSKLRGPWAPRLDSLHTWPQATCSSFCACHLGNLHGMATRGLFTAAGELLGRLLRFMSLASWAFQHPLTF